MAALITHPKTNISLSAREWAKRYCIAYSTMSQWFRVFGTADTFAALDKGDRPVHRGRKEAKWEHVLTGEKHSIAVWAKKYNVSVSTMSLKIRSGELPLIKKEAFGGRRPPDLIENPLTGDARTVSEWAEEFFGISRQALASKLNNFTPEGVFSGKAHLANEEKIINPHTGQFLYIDEWAIELGITPRQFRERLKENPQNLFAARDIDESDSMTSKKINIKNVIAVRNGARLLAHPKIKQEMLACDWAEYYGVSLHEFYQAMKRYKDNSDRLFWYFDAKRKSA